MKSSRELTEQRSILDKELDALQAKVKGGTITPDEETRFDAIIGEIEGLNDQITTAEKREKQLAEMESRKQAVPFAINPIKTDNEDQVKKEFRFVSLINQLSSNKPLEGFYREMHEEGQRDMAGAGIKDNTDGYVVPAMIIGSEKRDLAAVTNDTAKAGYTIATELLSNDWIGVLQNQLVVTGMGARFMRGLQGDIAVPKKTTNSGASWLTETGSITAGDHVWGQVTMSPKRLGNATAFSRKLLAQSSLDIEMIVREDLITSQSLALQDAIIHGAIGGNGPVGILNTSGIGAVAIGANGGALTWAKIVELESEVAIDNALEGNLYYLTNSKVRGAAKGIVRDSGSGLFLWGTGYGQSGGDATPLNGYRAAVTNSVPSTLSKGSSGAVCSALIFGNFADMMIGQWGGLVLTANPYALDLSGQVRITLNAFYDMKLRNVQSFAAIKDITTS